MWLFVLVYVVVYGGVHSYAFWRIRQALPGVSPVIWIATASWFVLMVAAPMAIRLLDRAGQFRLASTAAVVGHTWIAIIFWFACAMLACDMWNTLVRLLAIAGPGVRIAMLGPGVKCAAAVLLSVAACVVGLREAQDIRAVHVTIRALPAGSRPITLAQISDLHLGVDTGMGRLQKIIGILRENHPDVIVSTGDMLDSPYPVIADMAAAIADVHAPLGKYAIFGNHEFYAGVDNSTRFIEAAGFQLLRQQTADVAENLRLAGLDDPAGAVYGQQNLANEEDLLSPDRAGRMVILLKHQPLVRPQSLGRMDLQLSGHTHGGQIFPLGLIVNRLYRHAPGLVDLGNGSQLYINPGAGTWGPPMRLGAPPQVTIFHLEPK